MVDGGREIRVDPSWLAATHDSTELSTFSLDGVQSSTPLSSRTWKSPYVHLADCRSEVTFEAVADIITTDETDADPAEHYLESKAIPEGERLSVRGEVRVEQGEPVIRGSEETPLVLSDQGFDGLGSDLRTRVAKYGLISLGTLATAAVLVTRAFGVSPL